MKKVVVKTVAFTVIIIAVIFALSYALISTFSPGILANAYFRLGSEKQAVKYSELAYEKSDSVSDLATLTERVIIYNDTDKTVTYATLLLAHSDFESYAETKSTGYVYYVAGSLTEAHYIKGNKQVAVSVAFQNTSAFTSGNPVEVIISLSAENSDTETLLQIRQMLVDRQGTSDKVATYISAIDNYIND